MLKPEIADPQGQAIARALPRLGLGGVASVRQGKRFEIEITDPAERPEPPATGDGLDENRDTNGVESPVESVNEGVDESHPPGRDHDPLATARQIAETLLANPVIEDFEVRVIP